MMTPTRTGLLLAALGAAALPAGAARAPLAGPAAPGGATGQDEAEEAVEIVETDEVEAAIDAVLADYDDAMDAFSELYRKAQTDEERNAAFTEHYPQDGVYAARLWEIAQAHPAHAASGRALAWVVQNGAAQRDAAAALLLEHHIESEHVAVVCMVYEGADHGGRGPLTRIAEGSPHAAVRGLALLALGKHLLVVAERAAAAQAMDEAGRENLALQSGEAALIEWMDSDPVDVREEAEFLLERVMAEYAEELHPYGVTLGAQAEGALFEARRLQVGMPVPEIEGQDLDGKSFKLSDYRGKVVVLDFWGHW